MRGGPPDGAAEGPVPVGICADAGDAADNNSARPATALSDLAGMPVRLRSPASARFERPA